MSFKIIHHKFIEIDSTNSWAIRNFHSFDCNAITIITAKKQTNGRGRLNRQWESPFDLNLYTTYGFFVEENTFALPNIPQILALSCIQSLANLGVEAKIKWPNDLIVNDKKIAGILCEVKLADKQRFVALGIGINVNVDEKFLKKINKPATSILLEIGSKCELDTLQILLNKFFFEKLDLLFKKGFSHFFQDFQDRIYRPEELYFHDNTKIVKGSIHSFNQDGSISLLLEDGSIKTFHYGEIV